MDAVAIATSILSLVAGVGVFLVACTMMSSNLEALGSGKLKALFAKTSKSKLTGVGVGTATTAIIQSSSATSVMVIGFVNAGIMSLAQAATVIFGANIGTTVTGQLVALGMFGGESVSTSVIFGALAGIGAFVLAFAKKDKAKKIGGILAGFGMLFVGLSVMSDSMASFSEQEEVRNFLALFKNPLLLVLIGAVITGVVQSSSVMTSMTITMVATGLINLNQGIYITMGANIGTCVTALIAGLTSSRNAKRASLIHLAFNVGGVLIFLTCGLVLDLFDINYGMIFESVFPSAPQLQMSMFHTFFNVATTCFALPATNAFIKLVTKILPDKEEQIDGERLVYLEEHMLAAPPLAVAQLKKEIIDMANVANGNFNLACDMIVEMKGEKADEFAKNERGIDFRHKAVNQFVAKLLAEDLDERDKTYLSSAIRSASDIERVGDYAENITECYQKLHENGEKFSAAAIGEIRELQKVVNEMFDLTVKAYRDEDEVALSDTLAIEDKVDAFTDKMAKNHVARLEKRECSPEVGAQYLSLASNVERIADHYVNVAKTIVSAEKSGERR